jgi:tetratricopeptide (TPR) repeat protein
MNFRIILSGHLEFGPRSFDKALQLFQQRVETYYKYDVLLIKPEEFFFEENFTFDVPRLIVNAGDRTFRNTVSLLENLAQYAMAGSVSVWKLENSICLSNSTVEPQGDKTAVRSFLKGRELIVEGKQGEAREALSVAIEKFERHALAYERRGYVNYVLGNIEDALYDFSKSIDISPNSPDAYIGRSTIHFRQQNFSAALADLDLAVKTSIPHQPIHWKARRMKGECHLEMQEYDKASFEFKLVTNRPFKTEDPNHVWQRRAHFNYGRTLLAQNKLNEAIAAFDKAVNMSETKKDELPNADPFLYRGIARQKAGIADFWNDWKEAADRGSERARQLMTGIEK